MFNHRRLPSVVAGACLLLASGALLGQSTFTVGASARR